MQPRCPVPIRCSGREPGAVGPRGLDAGLEPGVGAAQHRLAGSNLFNPARAVGRRARIGFDIAGEQFLAALANGELPIKRGHAAQGQAVIRAPDASVVAGLLYAKIPVEQLEQEAGLAIEGDRELALRYAAIFALPDKLT